MTRPKLDFELEPPEEEEEEETTTQSAQSTTKTETQQLQQELQDLKKFHRSHPDLPQPDILYEEEEPTPSEEEIKSWEESAQQSFWWESDSGGSKGKGAWEYETEREKEAGYPVEEPKEESPYSIMSRKFIQRVPESTTLSKEKTETKFEEFKEPEKTVSAPPPEPKPEPKVGKPYRPLPSFSFFQPSMWTPSLPSLGYKPYEAYKEVRVPEVSKGTITEKLIKQEKHLRDIVKGKRAELEKARDPFSQIVKSVEFSLAGLGYAGYQLGEGFFGAIEQWRGLGNIFGFEQPVPPDPFTAAILPDMTTETEREWLRTHPAYIAGAIWGEAFDIEVLSTPFKFAAKGFSKLFPETAGRISEFLTTKPVLRHIFKKEGKVTEIVKGKERITGILGEGARVEELGEFFTKTRKTVGEESDFLKKLWEYVDSAELRFAETRGRARVLGIGLGEGAIIEETLEGEYVRPASKLVEELYHLSKTEKVVEVGKGFARVKGVDVPIDLTTRPGVPEDIIDYTRYIVKEYGTGSMEEALYKGLFDVIPPSKITKESDVIGKGAIVKKGGKIRELKTGLTKGKYLPTVVDIELDLRKPRLDIYISPEKAEEFEQFLKKHFEVVKKTGIEVSEEGGVKIVKRELKLTPEPKSFSEFLGKKVHEGFEKLSDLGKKGVKVSEEVVEETITEGGSVMAKFELPPIIKFEETTGLSTGWKMLMDIGTFHLKHTARPTIVSYPEITPKPVQEPRPKQKPKPKPVEEPSITPKPIEEPVPIIVEEPTVTPKPIEEPTITPKPVEEPSITPKPIEEPFPITTPEPIITEEPIITPEPFEEPPFQPKPVQEPPVPPLVEPELPRLRLPRLREERKKKRKRKGEWERWVSRWFGVRI